MKNPMKKSFLPTIALLLIAGAPVVLLSAEITAANYRATAQAKYDNGDSGDAIADYTKAIALNPADAEAYSGRGLARRANGDAAGALADCNQAIALNPNSVPAYSNRGKAKQAKGDSGGAATDFTTARKLQSPPPVEAPVPMLTRLPAPGQRGAGPTTEEKIHVRLIKLSRTAADTDDTLTEKARVILKRLASGESFADLAREFSSDGSRVLGGDSGWTKRSDFRDPFAHRDRYVAQCYR